MRGLRIGSKLICGFAICIILSAIIGTVAIVNLAKIKKDTIEVKIAKDIEKEVLECRRQEKNIMLFGPYESATLEGIKEKTYLQKVNNGLITLRKLVEEGKIIAEEEEEEEFNAILIEIENYEDSLKKTVADYNKGEKKIGPHILNMRKNGREIQGIALKIIGNAENRIDAAHKTAGAVVWLTFILAVVFGSGVGIWLSRNITNPIRKLTATTVLIAGGDLSQRVDIKSADEIGDLARSFNKMTEDLKKLLSDLKQIYDGAPSGMRVVDRKFNIVSQNEMMGKLSGIGKEEAKGMKCYEQLKGTLCGRENCTLKQVLKGKELVDIEVEKERADGKKFPCRVTASPFKDIADNIVGIIEVFTDITELKRLMEKEKELAAAAAAAAAGDKKSAEEWQNTFDSILDLVCIDDKDFNITRVNKAFAGALKLKPEDIIGKKCYELLHKSDKPWPNCPFEMTKKDKKPHTQEVDDPNIGIPLLVTTSPIFDDKGELIGTVHIAKDISDMKKAEEALKKKISDLERFRKVTVGREMEMVSLKKEINALLEKLDQPKKYEAPEKIKGTEGNG